MEEEQKQGKRGSRSRGPRLMWLPLGCRLLFSAPGAELSGRWAKSYSGSNENIPLLSARKVEERQQASSRRRASQGQSITRPAVMPEAVAHEDLWPVIPWSWRCRPWRSRSKSPRSRSRRKRSRPRSTSRLKGLGLSTTHIVEAGCCSACCPVEQKLKGNEPLRGGFDEVSQLTNPFPPSALSSQRRGSKSFETSADQQLDSPTRLMQVDRRMCLIRKSDSGLCFRVERNLATAELDDVTVALLFARGPVL